MSIEPLFFPFFAAWFFATLFFLIYSTKQNFNVHDTPRKDLRLAGAPILMKLIALLVFSFYLWIYQDQVISSWQLYQKNWRETLQDAFVLLLDFFPFFLALLWLKTLLQYIYAPSFILVAKKIYALVLLTGIYWIAFWGGGYLGGFSQSIFLLDFF